MTGNIEMYVMVREGHDPYSWKSTSHCTPIIKTQNGSIVEPEVIPLDGFSLLDWFKENPERLKYNFDNEIKDNGEFDYLYYNPKWKLVKILLDEGEVFNIREPSNSLHFDTDKRQYLSLLNRLEDAFNVIEPVKTHKDVYGITFREILLLSAMEVEVHWKALLKNNGYDMSRKGISTKDYIKLRDFIDFGSELKLSTYPDFLTLIPFESWDKKNPTTSLKWYDDYNKVKHDRSSNINLATLENALLSLAALRTMLSIRYTGFDFGKNSFDKDLFNMIIYPRPKYGSEMGRIISNNQRVKFFSRVN